jgi:hypothetical protein
MLLFLNQAKQQNARWMPSEKYIFMYYFQWVAFAIYWDANSLTAYPSLIRHFFVAFALDLSP